MTKKLLLTFSSSEGKTFRIYNDEFTDSTIIDDVENHYETCIPNWDDPMETLALLFALNSIDEIEYIDKNFDIGGDNLDVAFEYLNDTADAGQLREYLHSLEKICLAAHSKSIREYLLAQGI